MWKHVTSHMCCCDPPQDVHCAVTMYIPHSSFSSSLSASSLTRKELSDKIVYGWLLIWFLFRFQNDVSIHVPNSSSPHGPRADQPQGQGGEGDHRRPQALHHAQQPQQRGEVAWEVAQNCSQCINSSDLKASWLIWWRSSQLCWVSLSTSTITLRRSAVAKIKKI